MNRSFLRGLILCLVSTAVVVGLVFIGALDSWENKASDILFRLRGERPAESRIAIVAVDENTLNEVKMWPLPRHLFADLILKLGDAGASLMAFDYLFVEPSPLPAEDAALAAAVKKNENVVSAFFYQDGFEDLFGLGAKPPYPALEAAGPSGFVNLNPDADGVIRRAPLVALERGQGDEVAIEPSLALAVFMRAKNLPIEEVLAQRPTPLVGEISPAANYLRINFALRNNNIYHVPYPVYSLSDVLGGRLDLKTAFDNKIVFVGATAAGAMDQKAVPFVSIYPGVFIHANVLDNLLNNKELMSLTKLKTVLYVGLLGLVLGVLIPRSRSWLKLVLFVVAVAGVLGGAYGAFARNNMLVPLASPLLLILLSYGSVLFYQLAVEERERRKIKGSFRQYLSPKIIDVITQDPTKLKLGGEEREVSVFFLDIAGFTTMSEALKPAQLVDVMNQCLTMFSRIILKHDGLINKYIGDCIMAFWNAPMSQKNHAGLAALAALDCMKALPDLNQTFKDKGLPAIDCRIGINTGVVVVGNMGSDERFDYTVMGDAVNLASRLEGANKEYKTHIMVSDSTFDQARQSVEARELDLIRVKGKREPKRVFEVLAKKGLLPASIHKGLERYNEGLALYRKAQFQEAIAVFEEVFHKWPDDHVTRLYLERCRTFAIKPPPAGWDGVFEMKTK